MFSILSDAVAMASDAASDIFSSSCDITIALDPPPGRPTAEVKYGATRSICSVYTKGDDITGTVTVQLKQGRTLEHDGIMIRLIGRAEVLESPEYVHMEHYPFLSLVQSLSAEGSIDGGTPLNLPFSFTKPEKQEESYYGENVYVRYFLEVAVQRTGLLPALTSEREILVYLVGHEGVGGGVTAGDQNKELILEVGIQDCVHIVMCIQNTQHPVDSVITGVIMFKLVRLNIIDMDISLIKIESTKLCPNSIHYNYSTSVVASSQIMDYTPGREESVPIRWPLAGYNLSPTRPGHRGRFTVRYILKLTITDDRNRQYYKQCEVHLYRNRIATHDPSWYLEDEVDRKWIDRDARQSQTISSLPSLVDFFS